MWSQLVVDAGEGVELELEVSNRFSWSLASEEELQGLVEAFDLAAGLGVIGRGVNALNAEAVELGFEGNPAATGLDAKDSRVVAEEASRQAVFLDRRIEGLDGVRGLEGWDSDRGQAETGVVVDQVKDLDLAGVGEAPLGGVGLPELVGQLSLEAGERGLGAFVRFGRDQAMALEDAPDGDPRRGLVEAAGEVMEDGLWTGIEAGCREPRAELEDGVDNCLVELVRTGGWAVGSRGRPVHRDDSGRAARRTSCARSGAHEPVG